MMPAPGSADYEAYNEWLHYSEGSAMLPLMLNLYVGRLKEAGAPLHPRIDSEIANHLGYVDGALKGREFFVGKSLTGADIQMSFVGDMAKVFDKLGPYPNLERLAVAHARAAGVPALDREGRGVPVREVGIGTPDRRPGRGAGTHIRRGSHRAPQTWDPAAFRSSMGPGVTDRQRAPGATGTREAGIHRHPHHILHKYQPRTASAWPFPADVVSRKRRFRPPHMTDRTPA